MKHKNSGISLALAFISSMLVLFIALYTLGSISRSFERTVGIERSNKVFFAAESGVEAALFHKNSRTRGVHFDWEEAEDGVDPLKCSQQVVPSARCVEIIDSMKLNHVNTSTETQWKIQSRFMPESNSLADLTYSGELGEFQTIEIPLSYDNAAAATDAPALTSIIGQTMRLAFPKAIEDETSSGDPFNFGDNTSAGNIIIPSSPLGENQRRERPVIDWSILRSNSVAGVQNFVLNTSLEHPCYQEDELTRSNLVCETDLQTSGAGSEVSIDLQSGSLLAGSCQPCLTANCNLTLNEFEATTQDHCPPTSPIASNNSEYRLRLQSLVPYSHIDPTGAEVARISSIPYNIVLNDVSDQIVLPQYTVVSNVTQGDYQKEVSFTVNESSSLGAFNYVIFE